MGPRTETVVFEFTEKDALDKIFSFYEKPLSGMKVKSISRGNLSNENDFYVELLGTLWDKLELYNICYPKNEEITGLLDLTEKIVDSGGIVDPSYFTKLNEINK